MIVMFTCKIITHVIGIYKLISMSIHHFSTSLINFITQNSRRRNTSKYFTDTCSHQSTCQWSSEMLYCLACLCQLMINSVLSFDLSDVICFVYSQWTAASPALDGSDLQTNQILTLKLENNYSIYSCILLITLSNSLERNYIFNYIILSLRKCWIFTFLTLIY